MKVKELFGKKIKEARAFKGFTQWRLSELSGVHEKSIARYEAGAIAPSAENIVKLAKALEVSIDYLLLPDMKMEGMRKIKYPGLYERYLVLEELEEKERIAIETVLDSLIASQKMKEITDRFVSSRQ